MKKFTLILTALLMLSIWAVAQIKLVVCQEGGVRTEFVATSVDSIIFVDSSVEPDDSDSASIVVKPFSVSATKKVIFSPGNLQYHPANNEWRFALSQTDYIGRDNLNKSSTYNGWIDLFGWGTGNNPTNKNKDNEEYSTFVDWGVNKIGDDEPNTWRTLTYDEWYYLRWYRPNAADLIGVAQVNGVNGLVILPDAWECPEGVIFKPGFADDVCQECYANYQTISISDWEKLEVAGAVFFPAAGRHSHPYFFEEYKKGTYWSSTDGGPEYEGSALALELSSFGAYVSYNTVYYGFSVRLVKDN